MLDVALAPLGPWHAEATLRWLQDPVVAENIGLRSTASLERTQDFIARAAEDPTIAARAILEGGVHVGNVVLDHIDRHASKARLHVYVGEATARGRGVGKRAVALALDLAFGEVGVDKVWLTVHAGNANAKAVYLAAGFVVEGVHRAEFVLRGDRIDEIYMGVLRTDLARARA